LIDFFGEILKIVKLNCDPLLRQVTGIAQTISELKPFLPSPPKERASLFGEAIADYDPRCTAFGRTGNLHFPKTSSTPAWLSRTDLESGRVSGHGEAHVTLSKRHSLRSHFLYNPSGLL
jgi:hypothetical protein